MSERIAKGLPRIAFVQSPYTGAVCMVYRGESTLYGTGFRRIDEVNNERRGVTKAQAAAMLGGVLHGWETPQADPSNYDSSGHYLGRKGKA